MLQCEKIKPSTTQIKPQLEKMLNLPQEIIEEILVRLPVKSLLKFRCVSKSWLSFISSQKFIRTHLTTLDPALASYRLMLSISYNRIRHSSVSSAVSDLLTDVVDADADFPNVQKQTQWRFQISSSCNGLLCVYAYCYGLNHVFLWNPCLKVSKKLPPVTAEPDKPWEYLYSIGYDEPDDDYKVVAFFWYALSDGAVFQSMAQIYSLKNDSWKRIEDFKGGLSSSNSSVYTNGKIHFLAIYKHGDSSLRLNIASLDLENEVYGTIEQPEYDKFCSDISIGALKGCISALYSYERDYANVWVLKEYGVNESWTKLVRIPYVDGPISIGYNIYPYRLCILSNGKYLLGRGNQLVVYDPEDNSFVYPRICNIDNISSTGIYVESLVPLPS